MPILLVKVNTNNVPDAPGRYNAGQVIAAFDDNHEFTPAEQVSGGNFYHVAVTDKTLAEVNVYLAGWNHNPVTTQVSTSGNRRLINVASDMVSATGKNAFTQSGVELLVSTINENYPTALAAYESHTNTSFRFRATVPLSGRDALFALVNEAVYGMQYARRRWYITQAGMTYLANNGGTVSGTAAQVGGYLRDGLLD